MRALHDIERLAQEEIDLALDNIADIDDFSDDNENNELIVTTPSAATGVGAATSAPRAVREGTTARSPATTPDAAAKPPLSPGSAPSPSPPAAAAAPATSLARAAFHVFKSNVGAGVFLLPTFYTTAGSLAGFALALLAGCIMLDCTLMLLAVKHKISRSDVQTYPAVVKFVLGVAANNVVKFALVLTQFGFCTLYIQYTASLCAELFPFHNAYYVFVMLSVGVVTPLTFLTGKLHLLAFASIVATLCVVFCVVGSLGLSVQQLVLHGPAPSATLATWPPGGWVLFLSGHVMALEGIGVVLPVENSVERKDRFPTVIRRTIGSIVIGFMVFGQVGYFAFGTTLRSSLVHAFKESVFTAMLQLSLAVSLLLTYPIQYVPAIQIVDRFLKVTSPATFKAKTLRIGLNVFFGLMATGVGGETLGLCAEFLGASVGTHLTMTFPAMLTLQIDAALEGKLRTLTRLEYAKLVFTEKLTLQRIKCMLYSFFAIFVCVVGTATVFIEGLEMLTREPPEKVVFVPATSSPPAANLTNTSLDSGLL